MPNEYLFFQVMRGYKKEKDDKKLQLRYNGIRNLILCRHKIDADGIPI